MNAQKEAEYIAEIVSLKSKLSKLTGGASLDKINIMLACHSEEVGECEYFIEQESSETVNMSTPIANMFVCRQDKVKITFPPRITATKTIEIS